LLFYKNLIFDVGFLYNLLGINKLLCLEISF
jgi:hypothetical protein